jgi:hypothetical protein
MSRSALAHDHSPSQESECRIKPGMSVSTDQGSGPYLIREIIRDCTCGGFRAIVSGDNSPTASHLHLICAEPSSGKARYLNGYCEYTLESVWGIGGRLLIDGVDAEAAPAIAQGSLF